jgi:hypothetical protein
MPGATPNLNRIGLGCTGTPFATATVISLVVLKAPIFCVIDNQEVKYIPGWACALVIGLRSMESFKGKKDDQVNKSRESFRTTAISRKYERKYFTPIT